MNPGDLFEWVYECNSQPVFTNTSEQLWSFSMGSWIPIDQFNVLISIDELKMVWVNSFGTFSSFVSMPMITSAPTEPRTCVISRRI